MTLALSAWPGCFPLGLARSVGGVSLPFIDHSLCLFSWFWWTMSVFELWSLYGLLISLDSEPIQTAYFVPFSVFSI